MAEPSWYDFLIPSEETREAILKGIEAGKRDVRILKEEGPEALELRRKEQEFIDLGHDDETASILAKQAIENDPRIRIIPKDINFIGDAKASTIDTEETETEEVKDIKKVDSVGLGDKDDYEVGLGQSLTGAVVSAGIKFPKGIINFGTLVYTIMIIISALSFIDGNNNPYTQPDVEKAKNPKYLKASIIIKTLVLNLLI